ncbi:MAG TPA: hypothetical protein VM165_11115 [Planctomycetaceae bacterium]|nr:hypothetical protein [Planctomycetaceae bacterium]
MWCPSCCADVAAELTADDRRFLCTRCQTELGLSAATVRPPAARPLEAERDARELLARWTSQSLLDQQRKLVPLAEATTTKPVATLPMVAVTAEDSSGQEVPRRSRGERRRRSMQRETASVVTSPEMPLGTVAPSEPPRQGQWLSVVSQLAAYAGIGFLTCGAVLVISSQFGGPASYASTGWLVCTLGQMLFFLGLVTLVSTGLEQTSADLTRRIDRLHDHIRCLDAGHAADSEHGLNVRRRRRQRVRPSDAA